MTGTEASPHAMTNGQCFVRDVFVTVSGYGKCKALHRPESAAMTAFSSTVLYMMQSGGMKAQKRGRKASGKGREENKRMEKEGSSRKRG